MDRSVIDTTAMVFGNLDYGDNVRIDRGFHCTVNMTLGDYIHISPYVVIIGGNQSHFLAMGFNNIMTGAKIICASDRFDGSGLFGSLIPQEYKGTLINKPVIMDWFSNIGAGAIVLPGSHLRMGVLLTAGSRLMGDTEEWGVYDGSPAVIVRKIDGSKIIEYAKQLGYEI